MFTQNTCPKSLLTLSVDRTGSASFSDGVFRRRHLDRLFCLGNVSADPSLPPPSRAEIGIFFPIALSSLYLMRQQSARKEVQASFETICTFCQSSRCCNRQSSHDRRPETSDSRLAGTSVTYNGSGNEARLTCHKSIS